MTIYILWDSTYHDSQLITDVVEELLLVHSPPPHPEGVHVGAHRRLQQVLQAVERRQLSVDQSHQAGEFRSREFNLDSHSRGHLVLEGVGGDPVGAFEENRFAVDAEIEAQSCGTDNRFLDQLHGAKIHLQVEI